MERGLCQAAVQPSAPHKQPLIETWHACCANEVHEIGVRKMNKFTVVESDKKEPKGLRLPPRPDHWKRPRTYEDEVRSKKMWRALLNCGSPEELARWTWFDR
jgi:hypothetical protein